MELLLSFLVGLLLGIVIAFYKLSKIIYNPKTKGNWGEMALERILEASGLQQGVHYFPQESYRNEDDKLLRPDMVVCLPHNRQVVIDSKVFPDYKSVREHIKNLKGKFYEQIKDLNTPDFVIMFIPVESVFADIMRKHSDVFEYAWKNKILLTSPSTLLATLKTIELSWQRESQDRNVQEIAEESGKLYDKFVGFIGDFEAVKNRFEEMNRKLEGRGGLIQKAEKIKSLGAKASKDLPEKYLK